MFTEVMSSVELVSRALSRGRSAIQLDDADELIATHVAELHRRLRRLREREGTPEVRLAPAVHALHTGVSNHRNAWG